MAGGGAVDTVPRSLTAADGAALADARRALAEALDLLTAVDVGGVDGALLPELVTELEIASRRLDAVRARVHAAADADGRWSLDGSRSFSAWLRRATGASGPAAWRLATTARALRDELPVTAQALAAGEISTEQAAVLARESTKNPARSAALTREDLGERFLVEQAKALDAGAFARLVRAWTIAADPEGADSEWSAGTDRQELVLAKTTMGYRLEGWLDDANGAALDTALTAVCGVPGATDTRSPAQRRAGALVALARLALDSGTAMPGAAIRPHLTVHVSHETLTRLIDAHRPASAKADPASGDEANQVEGTPSTEITIPSGHDPGALLGAEPAELEDGTPIPPALLARLACDSELARVIFGPSGEVLDVGRTRRLFPGAQRRAVIARDRRCAFPGCDAPPRYGEVHHALWWYAHAGPTAVANGVLLCWHHHDYVHAHGITIRGGDPGAGAGRGDGRAPADAGPPWRFFRRNGREITAAQPGATAGGTSGTSVAASTTTASDHR